MADPLPRFYVADDADLTAGALVPLPDEEARHALSALRLADGAAVLACRADGRYAPATLVVNNRRRAAVRPGEVAAEPWPACRVTLFTALPKGKRWTWLVEKAAELGADAICPVLTRRAVARGEGDPATWRRWAREACKQCRRVRVPLLAAPVPLATVLPPSFVLPWPDTPIRPTQPAEAAAEAGGTGRETEKEAGTTATPGRLRLVAAPGGLSMAELLARPASPVATAAPDAATAPSSPPWTELHILVGPEGGLTDEETAAALDAGWQAAGLAATILRVETAALAALALAAAWRLAR